jgi:hypothetical protein
MASCFEHVNERSGFIKDGEFLDHLSDRQLLNKNSDSWGLEVVVLVVVVVVVVLVCRNRSRKLVGR